jgi:hypothetical protein
MRPVILLVTLVAISIAACSKRSPPKPATAATAGSTKTGATSARLDVAGAQAESSGSLLEYTYDQNGNITGVRVAAPMSISIGTSGTTVDSGGKLALTASGGSGTYTWSLATNNSVGSITSSGIYTGGSRSGVIDAVKVTDSNGAWATVTIAVAAEAPHSAPAVASVHVLLAAAMLAVLGVSMAGRPSRASRW